MFQIWRDEQMNEVFGFEQDGQQFQTIRFHQKSEHFDFVMYFGSPDAGLMLQTAENAGVSNITLTAQSVLPRWTGETTYAKGAIVSENGLLWQALNVGVSGSRAPNWGDVAGARTQEGGVIWQSLGAAHSPNAVKLALSESALPDASNSLSFGTQLRGGAAVAVYVRVLSQVKDVYGLPTLGQIGLVLNDCEAVSAL